VVKDGNRGERRMQWRYPVALELQYKIIEGGEVVKTGTGRTGNISSGGVLFQTENELAQGPAVELSIRWPTVAVDAPFVELRMTGRIVRSDAHGIAVEMRRYHFQKMGEASAAVNQPFDDTMIQ